METEIELTDGFNIVDIYGNFITENSSFDHEFGTYHCEDTYEVVSWYYERDLYSDADCALIDAHLTRYHESLERDAIKIYKKTINYY
jgi:hypothetical protein